MNALPTPSPPAAARPTIAEMVKEVERAIIGGILDADVLFAAAATLRDVEALEVAWKAANWPMRASIPQPLFDAVRRLAERAPVPGGEG